MNIPDSLDPDEFAKRMLISPKGKETYLHIKFENTDAYLEWMGALATAGVVTTALTQIPLTDGAYLLNRRLEDSSMLTILEVTTRNFPGVIWWEFISKRKFAELRGLNQTVQRVPP